MNGYLPILNDSFPSKRTNHTRTFNNILTVTACNRL